MNNLDYRCNSYHPIDFSLSTIINKKKSFIDEFKAKHSLAKQLYSNLDKNSKTKLKDIYERHCAYCGTNTVVRAIDTFEIDHFIPESLKREGYDTIENLVCACKDCNRKKMAFSCKVLENELFLHPDKEKIKEVFFRSEDYFIKVSPEYEDNEDVREFYTQLDLQSNRKRLEYLIIEINDFCDTHPTVEAFFPLKVFICDLQRKWNNTY